ncbi:MAG: copper resistance protein CopC [Verrucomicrobia bacterium]|nr:copper resistance protein CopC [Verrucomicrobiota bacterium]
MMRSPWCWLLALWLLAGVPCSGWAHAFLDHAEPAVGSHVHAAPARVTLWFTEKLEPALSRVQVFDASGQEVDRRDVRADPADPAILEVSLPPLKPGKYKVSWRAVSVDTHVTTGTFGFDVVL